MPRFARHCLLAALYALALPAAADLQPRFDLWDADVPRLVEAETLQADFTQPASYALLGSGWHTELGKTNTFPNGALGAMSIDAELFLRVNRPRALTLHLRMQPNLAEKYGAQEVTVVWNGVRLGVCTFNLADRWDIRDFSLAVPADAVKAGANQLRLLSRYALSQREIDDGNDGRIFAFALHALALSSDDQAQAAAPEAPAEDGIAQAADTRIVFPFYLDAPVELAFSGTARPAATANARIVLRQDTVQGPRETVFAPGADTIPLGTAGPGAVSVTLESLGGPTQWDTARILSSSVPKAVPTPPATETPQVKNVLLIILDALRADNMGYHGYPRDTSPFIDTLAMRGVTFPRAYSAASYTFSSTFSLVTGRYQFQHKAIRAPELPAKSLTRFPTVLREAGIYTGCVSANPNLNVRNGTVADFDDFRDGYEGFPNELKLPKGVAIQKALMGDPEAVTRNAQAFLEEHHEQRFLLYAHYRPPHHPYYALDELYESFALDPTMRFPSTSIAIRDINEGRRAMTEEARKQLIARYDENIRTADAEVEKLYRTLESLGVADDTAVIVTSDHAEAFLEHRYLTHALSSYNAQVHIPLLIYVPQADGGITAHTGGVASTVDLYPTVCALLGVDPPEGLPGRNLLAPAPAPDPTAVRALSETSGDHLPHEGWFFDRYKLVRNKYRYGIEVYDLERDPNEQNDLAAQFPVLSDFLLANVEHWRAANAVAAERETSEGDQLDEAMVQQLEALGYVD